MAKAYEHWTVLPHRPLERLSPSLLTVTGDLQMPLTSLERRMTLVRLRDGRLVIYSAIALDEPGMHTLEQFGSPAFLIVPNHLHRSDALIWKRRYPKLTVVAPTGARARVEEVVSVDTCAPDFQDPAVRFVEVAGTGGRESALEVREGEHVTLVLNDIVGNLPRSAGFVLRVLGFATDTPKVPGAIKRALVRSPHDLRAQLEAWAEQPVERILVSHGRPILAAAQQALRDVASSL
jgi:hypothetical protein